MTKYGSFHDFSIIIIGGYPYFPLDENYGLGFGRMVVHWYLGARLQSIDETMAFIVKTLVEIVVHPEAWRLLSSFYYFVY
jgi:hypothetical protein